MLDKIELIEVKKQASPWYWGLFLFLWTLWW